MKVKRTLALIAFPQSVNYICNEGFEWRIDFSGEDAGLFATGNSKELFILPISRAREVEAPREKKAEKTFEVFTGFEVERALEFSIPDSRAQLEPIGRITEIEYRSDKWTGKDVLYVHSYNSPVTFYSDRVNPEKAEVFGIKSNRGSRLLSKRGLIL
jgi:hypothetical protein